MRIRSFHIDGFGIFSDLSVDNLPQGLSIFLGNNEAGKSTCLDFFRAMLTGYPDPRSREARERPHTPLRGGQPGGTLTLETHKHGLVRLTRRPGNGGGSLNLLNADGQALDVGLLDQWLAGVTREVYRNVFGFSLSELQTFESLNSEGVRHALYGASFGMGLRSPGQVLKTLDEQMEQIFKGQGSKPQLNAALRQWETLRQAVQEAEAECARFDTLTLEKSDAETALTALRQRKILLGRQRHDEEKRLGVWALWDEWRGTSLRLERLEEVVPTFPQDGPARLERARLNAQAAARHLEEQEQRFGNLEEQLGAALINEDLLAAYPALQNLAERKMSFRQAQSALPATTAALQRSQGDLRRLLSDLGPDWTCERIRGTNRSLFARGELERQASEMQAAEQAHVAATAALEKANRLVEQSEHSLELAQNTLTHLPTPVAALDDAGREHLRRTLAQIEDNRQRLPEKKQALQTAKVTFNRTFGPLHLRPGPVAPALDTLADAQEKALELATVVQTHVREAQDAAQFAAQLHELEEAAKGRVDRLRIQQRSHQAPSRTALDARTAAVRSLRHLHSAYSVEQDRLAEAESRIKATPTPSPMKSLPLIVIGALLMLCGVAVLLARWKLGITDLALTPQLVMPITLWSGYLVILTGVGFLAGGLPRSGPEAQRHAAEMEHLQERHTACRLRLTELEAQIQEQCVLAEVLNADAVTLDATELLLEREREQCVTDERLSQEMATFEAEHQTVREKARQAQIKSTQAEGSVQQARRRWHEFLMGFHVQNIPAPEAAAAFFARVEAARVAHSAVAALEDEVQTLEAKLADDLRAASAIPPVAEVLFLTTADSTDQENKDAGDKSAAPEAPAQPASPTQSTPYIQAILEAVRKVLDNCREADAAEEERLKAAAALHNAEINVERASTMQGEAADALHRSEDILGAARAAWSSSLEELGLGLELVPGMVREALECMERCLTSEAEVARLEDEGQRHQREIQALLEPLTRILEELGRPVPQGHDVDDADWMALLDRLLAEAQDMDEVARQHKHVEKLLDEQSQSLHTARRALEDADGEVDSLLALAEAPDAEEFLRLAEVKRQREELQRRREDLEDALRLAADDKPLDDFLNSFAHMDKQERESQVITLGTELESLDSQEQSLTTQVATLGASLQSLTTANRLAELRQEEAELAESMHRMADTWSRHALARHMLMEAKRRFERERQPQVIRAASEIFASITDSRWQGLTASLEDSSLSVLPPQGEPVNPEVLSRGTQEQMYLAMRLAYIRNHAAHASALPVIMDDILVNFDPARARRTAQAFVQLTKGAKGTKGTTGTTGAGDAAAGHQVLFFTCHPHMADMLQELAPDSRRFVVENAGIVSV